jgi:hypothetical protein
METMMDMMLDRLMETIMDMMLDHNDGNYWGQISPNIIRYFNMTKRKSFFETLRNFESASFL